MKTVLLVLASETLRPKLMRALEDTSVFTATSDEEALRTLRLTEMELIIKEVAPPLKNLAPFITRARHLCPTGVIVCVLTPATTSAEDESAAETADFVLLQPFTTRHLQSLLKQAEDKLRLLQEVAALRAARRPAAESSHEAGPPVSLHALTQMVKEFAKALAAGFDLPRVLDQFLDGVAELARPSRCAILLADPGTRHYRVSAYRALAPHVVESLTLSADSGLPLWLATEGRLIQLDEAQSRVTDPATREITRELAVLQAVLAIPLSSHGELVGILTLGQRITGGGYRRDETETLFNLGTHLATAIRDIRVHHLLQYEKEFNERILARMSSGVITIDPEQKVVAINGRALEILAMPAREVLQRDLRALPSPLGDMLFETLSKGRSVTRVEVQLALRSLPLEVSTYPVMGDSTEPMGAVLVFEDLTAQRLLAQERRGAEQLQLLTQVVARIADEIKNPLVSINAFMELIGERYDDATFRNQFSSVVGRDVRRLVQIFDKLAALVNDGDYKRETLDLRQVAEECLAELGAQALPDGEGKARLLTFTDESTQKHVTATLSHEGPSFLVRGDHAMFKKAMSYLVWYLLRKTPDPEAKVAVSISHLASDDRVRLTVASRSAEVRVEELQGIFDPIQVVQANLIDVGPSVSQRIIESQGGRLEAKQGRGEVSFTASLPATGQP
ncbi:MAG TPA: GAF domain-containing protein [Candidatus Limnocylindria bacterium]|nr:GAF domain-containing protein [Candidatus Limnocylindria bacterium]